MKDWEHFQRKEMKTECSLIAFENTVRDKEHKSHIETQRK